MINLDCFGGLLAACGTAPQYDAVATLIAAPTISLTPLPSAKELIAEAIDLVVQVGFRLDEHGNRRRRIIGVWSLNKILRGGNIEFSTLYHLQGDDESRLDLLAQIEKQFHNFADLPIKEAVLEHVPA